MATNLEEIKQDYITDLKQKAKDHILEPKNAEVLIKLIEKAETSEEALIIKGLGTTYKKTGFHFDMRMDKRQLGNTIRYFKRNDELSFGEAKDGEPVHKLIIGDNYYALQNLLIQYRHGIDVIYIDPPYGKDSMGEYADTAYDNAISRENLLSMLYFRLQLAKQLMSDNGVIFCSIDDKNQAYIKCLFDDVFDESSFVANLSIESSVIAGPRRYAAVQGSVVKTAEYCLVYSRSGNKKIMRKPKYDYIEGFDDHYCYWLDEANKRIVSFNDVMKENDVISNEFKKYDMDVSLKSLNKIISVSDTIRNWLYSEEISSKLYRLYERVQLNEEKKYPTFEMFKQDGKWYIRTNECVINVFRYCDRIGNCDDYYKHFGERAVRGNLWKGFSSDGGNLDKEGFVSYKGGKKPLRLISQLIDAVCPSDNSVILDFFAGSGTTGHAVLELNKQDGGRRTFILCQQNEKGNNIGYDITSKRLKRIMTGKCYDENIKLRGNKNFKPYGGKLEVYEINEVDNDCAVEGQTPFDVIDETLYGEEKFTDLRGKIDWVCSNFEQTQRNHPKEEE